MPPLISVIIPNRDCPLVGEAVAALRPSMDQHGVELLVVGTDRPGALAAELPIRLIDSDRDLSPAGARNRGVEEAEGELLLFTDADCRPSADWIEHLVGALTESPIVGGAVTFDHRANRWAVADNIASFHALLEDRKPERDTTSPVGTLNLGVTRKAWNEVGGFDESLITSEDFDWFLRARDARLAVAFEPRALVEHAAVRRNRREMETHAAWYGRHFPAFRRKHPGVFDRGPTWRNRGLFRLAAPLKAWLSARAIYRRHPILNDARDAFPGVVTFKLAWYRAVAAAWKEL